MSRQRYVKQEPAGDPVAKGRNGDHSKSVICYQCHRRGHYKADCPQRHSYSYRKGVVSFLHSPTRDSQSFRRFCQRGKVDGQEVDLMIDTGSSCTLVQRNLVSDESLTGETMEVTFADGRSRQVPLAHVEMAGPVGVIEQAVGVLDRLPVDVIVGHDAFGVTSPLGSNEMQGITALVRTRSQAKAIEERDRKRVGS